MDPERMHEATVLIVESDPPERDRGDGPSCHILPHVEGPEGMFGMVTALVVQ